MVASQRILRYGFLASILTWSLLAQSPKVRLPAVHDALDEAVQLALTLEPFPYQEAETVANIVVRISGVDGPPVVEQLVIVAQSDLHDELSALLAAQNMLLALSKVDPDRALRLWSRNQELPGGALADRGRLWLAARVDPEVVLNLLQENPLRKIDSFAYGEAVRTALETGRQELAHELVTEVYRSITVSPMTYRATRWVTSFVSGLGNLSPDRRPEGYSLLARKVNEIKDDPDSSYTLKTDVGETDLSVAEFVALELIQGMMDFVIGGISYGLERSPPEVVALINELEVKAREVGGWEAMERGYTFEQKGRQSHSTGGGNKQRSLLHGIQQLESERPQAQGWSAADYESSDGLRRMLFRLSSPEAAIDTDDRDEQLQAALDHILSMEDLSKRTALIQAWLRHDRRQVRPQEITFWKAEATKLDVATQSRYPYWTEFRRQLLQRWGNQNFPDALTWVRENSEPDLERLKMLITLISFQH